MAQGFWHGILAGVMVGMGWVLLVAAAAILWIVRKDSWWK